MLFPAAGAVSAGPDAHLHCSTLQRLPLDELFMRDWLLLLRRCNLVHTVAAKPCICVAAANILCAPQQAAAAADVWPGLHSAKTLNSPGWPSKP